MNSSGLHTLELGPACIKSRAAIAPKNAPSGSEPTSPMNTLAGGAFKKRKGMYAPAKAASHGIMANSPLKAANKMNPKQSNIPKEAARPSKPSAKLYALQKKR